MAVRRVILLATLACLALGAQAWAGSYSFDGAGNIGKGLESFTPGSGNALTISAGNGGNGAMITAFVNSYGLCGGNCSILSGYVDLTTGGETSGSSNGTSFSYTFGGGGSMQIFGKVPSLGINSVTLLFSASFLPGAVFSGSGGSGTVSGPVNTNTIILNAAFGGPFDYTSGKFSDLSFNVPLTCEAGGSCSGGSIRSSTNPFTIPEPATLSVVGVGLVVLGTRVRRRMDRTKPPAVA